MADNNTVILRVQLDEGKTQDQLKQLTLDIEKTRAAQAALIAERKAGTKSDEDFAAESVKLQQQLAGQRQEYSGLNKTLDLYQKSMQDNYAGTQAQLSLAQIQFQKTAGSQDLSTESAKALSGVIGDLRGQLTKTDEANLLFVRSVGNYPKGESLEPLIKQLVLLQEVEKQLPAGSQQAIEAQKQIGFQFGKVNEAAAAAGLAQKDVTSKLADYGERLRPVSADLAKLTIAQDQVAQSTGKESAEFAKIGFQIGATRKEIEKVPAELAKVPTTAETATKALSDTASKGLGLFGDQTGKVTGLLGKFKSGSDLVAQGLSKFKGAGETGSLGFKAIASGIALTGIGLFVIAISAVVTYLTQTAEGGRILKGVLSGLGATVQVLTDLVTGFGKTLFDAVKNPKQAMSDLVQFIEDRVVSSFKGFAVIFDGIRNRDLKQVTNGFIQVTTSIDNASSRAEAFGKKLKSAYDLGQSFADREKELTIARRQQEIDEVKEQSRVSVLIRLSKDRTLSSKEQLANLREAGRVEEELTNKSIALQQKELQLTKDKITAAGKGKGAGEFKAQLAEQEKGIAQTLAAQDELNAKIKARESIFIQQQNTAAAAAAKQRAKDAVAAKQTENELALVAVEKGSAAELALKRRAIDLAADFELAGEKKTQEQIKLVRAKAEGDKLDLLVAYQEKEIALAKQLTAARLAEVRREYAEAEQNLTDYLTEKRAALAKELESGTISQNTYEKQLNAIDKAGYDAALVNAADYGQDKAKLIKAQSDLEIKEAHRVKDEKKKIEDTKQQIQDAAFEAAATTSDLVISLYGEESAAGQAALITKKTLATAEILVNTEKQLIVNAEAGAKISAEAPPITVPLGVAYTATTDAVAIATAAASISKILGFRDGGVVYGPSHEQGGIDMYHTSGARIGNMQGGEIIMTKGVWDNPLLRPLASALNVMGGGAPLLPRAHMALGGIAPNLVREQLRGSVGDGIDYERLAQATARALRQSPPVTKWSDFKAAEGRAAQTQQLSNS